MRLPAPAGKRAGQRRHIIALMTDDVRTGMPPLPFESRRERGGASVRQRGLRRGDVSGLVVHDPLRGLDDRAGGTGASFKQAAP
jgi:hypothetical protein